mmetsp:Transcript_1803/g.3099  ORF Transcript_1803/g.3099 Transcript_1803/m.3099 type:complete len:340 (-) Transcript_1803:447-1466(-)
MVTWAGAAAGPAASGAGGCSTSSVAPSVCARSGPGQRACAESPLRTTVPAGRASARVGMPSTRCARLGAPPPEAPPPRPLPPSFPRYWSAGRRKRPWRFSGERRCAHSRKPESRYPGPSPKRASLTRAAAERKESCTLFLASRPTALVVPRKFRSSKVTSAPQVLSPMLLVSPGLSSAVFSSRAVITSCTVASSTRFTRRSASAKSPPWRTAAQRSGCHRKTSPLLRPSARATGRGRVLPRLPGTAASVKFVGGAGGGGGAGAFFCCFFCPGPFCPSLAGSSDPAPSEPASSPSSSSWGTGTRRTNSRCRGWGASRASKARSSSVPFAYSAWLLIPESM